MRWIVHHQYDGMLLRTYLQSVAKLSTRLLKRAKRGKILVNGTERTVRYVIKEGDVVEIEFPYIEDISITASEIPLHIIYEDEHLLIINKQPNLPTIPSRLYPTESLANGIAYYYKEKGISQTVHTVTRLDKDTSGLVLIAKHPHAHSLLAAAQRNNRIKRQYIAIVNGRMNNKSGMIDAPIGRKENSMIKREVRNDGKRALTHYEKLQARSDYTFVKIQLQTGRTHQIRVHFSYLGYPLLGDTLYGGSAGFINRQALHCEEISFVHPYSSQQISFTAPLFQDMANLWIPN